MFIFTYTAPENKKKKNVRMHENVHLGDQQTQDFLVGDYTFKKLTKDPKGKALANFAKTLKFKEIQRNFSFKKYHEKSLKKLLNAKFSTR